MTSPFSFQGNIGRARYVALSLAIFFSQHIVVAALQMGMAPAAEFPWWFWLNPLRLIVRSKSASAEWIQLVAMIMVLAVDWMLVALAFRRSKVVRGGAIAPLAVAPGFQVIAILWLSLAPEHGEAPTAVDEAAKPRRRDAVIGLLTGAGLCVVATVLSALVFGTYGYGLFLASPFTIGLTTAYIANRKGGLTFGRTFGLVSLALCLGALGLLAFALEGAICLVLAAPLIFGVALVGCVLGEAAASTGRRGRGTTMMSVAVAPLLMVGEMAAPPKAGFESVESVEVNAPPAAVWDAVIHMGPIPSAPAFPFRWGLAYPVRGEITGSGVGAIRRGVFSTGVAYERVTEWEPGRKLSFIVLSDPPTMRELSPYRNVNAPHVRGYFRTLDARFSMDALPSGKTRLTLITQHELDLEPALYWTPLAQWATHVNKTRVLNHFRRQAEAAPRPAAD